MSIWGKVVCKESHKFLLIYIMETVLYQEPSQGNLRRLFLCLLKKVINNAQKTVKILPVSRLSGAYGREVLSKAHERIQPTVQPGRTAGVF